MHTPFLSLWEFFPSTTWVRVRESLAQVSHIPREGKGRGGEEREGKGRTKNEACKAEGDGLTSLKEMASKNLAVRCLAARWRDVEERHRTTRRFQSPSRVVVPIFQAVSTGSW